MHTQSLTQTTYQSKDFHSKKILKNPQDGCPVTIEFVQHLFGVDFKKGMAHLAKLIFGYDEHLPVLCLTSKENNSGKSSVINLLKILSPITVHNINKVELLVSPLNQGGIYVCDDTLIPKIIYQKVSDYNRCRHTHFLFITMQDNLRIPNHLLNNFWPVNVPALKESKPGDIRSSFLQEREAFISILHTYLFRN